MNFIVAEANFSPFHILLEPTHELEEIADRIQNAKGLIPLFDDSGEYDPDDWYDFFLECNVMGNKVNKLYFEYGLGGGYGDVIELGEQDKEDAYEAVLKFYGGQKEYDKFIEEYTNEY